MDIPLNPSFRVKPNGTTSQPSPTVGLRTAVCTLAWRAEAAESLNLGAELTHPKGICYNFLLSQADIKWIQEFYKTHQLNGLYKQYMRDLPAAHRCGSANSRQMALSQHGNSLPIYSRRIFLNGGMLNMKPAESGPFKHFVATK